MQNSATILYHGDCPDGFGAAYAAWRRFGADARYVPVHHGQPWPREEVAGRDVYILDFSFPPEELAALARTARSVLLLDHHATARQPWADRLELLPGGLAVHRPAGGSLTVAFDLDKSGARLAWEHFHPGEPLPLPLAHVEDQDLWHFRIPGTRAFGRALRLLPYDFEVWDGVVRDANRPDSPLHRQMVAEGEAIERFCALEVERLGNSGLARPVALRAEAVDPLQARRHGLPTIEAEGMAWRTVTGLAINASSLFSSDLGNLLAEKSGRFGLVWQVAGDGTVRSSLRAAGRVDVAALAQNYGGGGHPNAAGFRLPLEKFASEILAATPFP